MEACRTLNTTLLFATVSSRVIHIWSILIARPIYMSKKRAVGTSVVRGWAQNGKNELLGTAHNSDYCTCKWQRAQPSTIIGSVLNAEHYSWSIFDLFDHQVILHVEKTRSTGVWIESCPIIPFLAQPHFHGSQQLAATVTYWHEVTSGKRQRQGHAVVRGVASLLYEA